VIVPQPVPVVLAGDHPGGLGYIAPGLTFTALIVAGLWVPAQLRSAQRWLRRRGSGR
jgi:hypothetical protein